ncbi:MAG: chemotaxis protein CheW [Rhodocyclaceae bacterium]|nr:chemotaxis protein CheW [Rhodocyclaceae bacterium]
MSIDISQFFQVFFEECAEHLASMENLLLELDPSDPDPEQLNAIFRAAHSIKGGAGTFGFTDIANTTHSLETLLDRLRKEEIALRPEMIDAFLHAKDVIAAQLAERRGESTSELDADAAEGVMKWLDVLAGADGHAPGDAGTGQASPPSAPAAPDASRIPLARFDIAVHSDAVDEAVIEGLIGELRSLGSLEVTAEPDDRHSPSPRPAPRTWRMVLTAAVAEAAVRELFEFVVPPEDVEVSVVLPGEVLPASDLPQVPAAAEAAYGFFDDDEAGPGIAGGMTAASGDADPDEGFGFFDDAPGVPAASAAGEAETQGFGFFDEAPGAPAAAAPHGASTAPTTGPASVGRRVSDRAADAPVRAGRRATDKQVTTAADSASIRVGVEKVDMLMNLVSELVITQSMLMQSASALDQAANERLLAGLGLLGRNTRDLQEAVMSIRMLPISFVFSRFPRVVRDLASKLGKQVDLRTCGESAELDKGLIEKIADPLTHLVRNSLDHGIEAPDVRVAAGKPATGTITLNAMHQGGSIVIEVSDDGGGLNRERILQKARERGLPANDGMTDGEVWQLIFEPGFSTADVITDVSGRGVGMDVVKRNIAEMNGSVSIESKAGQGTRIAIRLPLTMAILDGLSVKVGGSTLILPLNSIVESIRPGKEAIRTVGGRARTIAVRGEYLNVIELRRLFCAADAPAAEMPVMVIVDAAGQKAALCVDELLGQHQVVIKSLETNYRKVNGVSGATIMGDGRVALIVDVPAVMRTGNGLAHAA